MEINRLPIIPRLCFNWLPTYRYGVFAYRALQQACAVSLREGSNGLELGSVTESNGLIRKLSNVRPVAIDSVLQLEEHGGYLDWQFSDVLEPFEDGRRFFPLTEDLALIVAKDGLGDDLLNNVIPYMTPAPLSVTALLAMGGGYAGIDDDRILRSHEGRKAATADFRSELARRYDWPEGNILVHLNAVGGLIEATLRNLHRAKPGFRTCVLTPEYWDFLRLVLTYSAKGLRLVPGREQSTFPGAAWVDAVSQKDNDLVYLSVSSNPVGTVIPEKFLIESLEAVSDDTLYLLDCTSVDTDERSSEAVVTKILKRFSHKNLMVTKSFSKEYDIAEMRVGYALFTRPETARATWRFMAGYPSEYTLNAASTALKTGMQPTLDYYRKANRLVREMAEEFPDIRFTGDCSNYTLAIFDSAKRCTEVKELLRERYGATIYPGELPMQGGGSTGLGAGETSLATIQNIPFLEPEALRLVVTLDALEAFRTALKA